MTSTILVCDRGCFCCVYLPVSTAIRAKTWAFTLCVEPCVLIPTVSGPCPVPGQAPTGESWRLGSKGTAERRSTWTLSASERCGPGFGPDPSSTSPDSDSELAERRSGGVQTSPSFWINSVLQALPFGKQRSDSPTEDMPTNSPNAPQEVARAGIPCVQTPPFRRVTTHRRESPANEEWEQWLETFGPPPAYRGGDESPEQRPRHGVDDSRMAGLGGQKAGHMVAEKALGGASDWKVTDFWMLEPGRPGNQKAPRCSARLQ